MLAGQNAGVFKTNLEEKSLNKSNINSEPIINLQLEGKHVSDQKESVPPPSGYPMVLVDGVQLSLV